jgi:hypothetical protein
MTTPPHFLLAHTNLRTWQIGKRLSAWGIEQSVLTDLGKIQFLTLCALLYALCIMRYLPPVTKLND